MSFLGTDLKNLPPPPTAHPPLHIVGWFRRMLLCYKKRTVDGCQFRCETDNDLDIVSLAGGVRVCNTVQLYSPCLRVHVARIRTHKNIKYHVHALGY